MLDKKYWKKRQILRKSSFFFIGIPKGLNLGLKAEKQLQNKNRSKDWGLGSPPRDNDHVTH